MSEPGGEKVRHFLSYSGIKLPLKLVSPLEENEVANRNTYYRGIYNENEQMIGCQKIVYGKVELEHRYNYYDSGILKQAEIIDGEDEINIIRFDEQGTMVR